LCGTRRAALAEHDEFAITGADRIDGDDGVLPVLEFCGVLLVQHNYNIRNAPSEGRICN
jgi:hypothetical protein